MELQPRQLQNKIAHFAAITAIAGAMMLAVGCSPIRQRPLTPVAPRLVGSTLERADLAADADMMFATMEAVHPDLYAKRSREEVAAASKRMLAGMTQRVGRADFWTRLSPIVASLGDGHTSLWLPGEEIVRRTHDGELLFPYAVAVASAGDGATQVVISDTFGAGGALKPGDRVVEINGQDTADLLFRFTQYFSGESAAFRSAQAAGAFRELLLMHGIPAPFEVRAISADGSEHVVMVAGMKRDDMIAQARARQQQTIAANQNFTYRQLGEGVAYMNFTTFSSMSGDLKQFKEGAAAMFAQARDEKSKTLIIDLRSNGGGDSRMADVLFSHFTWKPYRMEARKEWKMSSQYRAYLRSMLRPPLGWLHVERVVPQGRSLFSGAPGKLVTLTNVEKPPKRAEPYFDGAVCLLIGPGTFSSAVEMADAAKTAHLATLVGEETGGWPNTFGEVYTFRLPHSMLTASVSSARFVRSSGDASVKGGVKPDIEVRTATDERRAGHDAALDRARSCPPI